MSCRLMIQGVVCMHVVCSLLLAQRLPRERWGAPLVNVSREKGMWIVEGRKNRLSLCASDLAMTVQAGPVTWKMGPSAQKDMPVKSRGEECYLHLADAGRIEISPYDSGAKTGLKIRLERLRHTDLLNRGLELALCLTACLEGKDEELVCEAVATEREASVRYLDWPREMDARDVNYRVTTFDELAQQLREMKSRGVDRAYVTLAGWPCLGYDRQHPDVLPPAPDAGGWEGLKRWVDTCKELGYLYNLHDQYRDYYVDAPSYDPQFAVHEEDATSRPTAFPGTRFGTWKEGCIPFMDYWDGGKMAYLNARFAPGHLIKNYQLIFDRGIRMQGGYLDVFGYVPPTEDFNPEHPLTRADCMEYRAKCFRWVRNNLGIVGTEAGADWVVPYVDYSSAANAGRCISAPLYGLVYHDAIVTPEGGTGDHLRCLLNGGYPTVGRNEESMQRMREIAALHRRVALLEMTNHEFLDKNHRRERSTFADGTTVSIDRDAGTVEIEPPLEMGK